MWILPIVENLCSDYNFVPGDTLTSRLCGSPMRGAWAKSLWLSKCRKSPPGDKPEGLALDIRVNKDQAFGESQPSGLSVSWVYSDAREWPQVPSRKAWEKDSWWTPESVVEASLTEPASPPTKGSVAVRSLPLTLGGRLRLPVVSFCWPDLEKAQLRRPAHTWMGCSSLSLQMWSPGSQWVEMFWLSFRLCCPPWWQCPPCKSVFAL